MAENLKWYVLKSISGKEQKVKEAIEAACKNTDLGQYVSQVLIPTEKVVQVKNGKKVVKDHLFLPGYVLVEANLVRESYPLLRNIPNVLGFLSSGRLSTTPMPVRQAEINRILGVLDEKQVDLTQEISFLVGETVKVIAGPFNGFNGIITEVLADKKKLRMEVTIFGRKSPLELDYTEVEKE